VDLVLIFGSLVGLMLLGLPIMFAMGLSALAGFAGMAFGAAAPLLGIVLAFPAYLANTYILSIARSAAALPFAAFMIPAFPFWIVLAAYISLACFILRLCRVRYP